MFRARAWAAAVPPAVWTAVAGLVLLASVGLALVVGAGLSVWRGGVSGVARPPAVVVSPPRSGLVVVSPPPTAGAPGVPRALPHTGPGPSLTPVEQRPPLTSPTPARPVPSGAPVPTAPVPPAPVPPVPVPPVTIPTVTRTLPSLRLTLPATASDRAKEVHAAHLAARSESETAQSQSPSQPQSNGRGHMYGQWGECKASHSNNSGGSKDD